MTAPVMSLLHNRVPLTLLCDLVSLADPDSATINSVERPERDPIRLEVAEYAKYAELQTRWEKAATA
jgi:hypothetical protein